MSTGLRDFDAVDYRYVINLLRKIRITCDLSESYSGTVGFPMISGGIERDQWHEIG